MSIVNIANSVVSAPEGGSKKDVVQNPKGIIDKNGFLKLLVAQLRYQDPLQPLSNDQFIQENTGFSQLEQLTNLNKAISSLSTGFSKNDKNYAASYLGKYIATNSNSITVKGSAIDPVSFKLSKSADVDVNIVDEKGNNVASVDMGNLSEGVHKFVWDGKDKNGNYVSNGTYSVMLFAKSSDGSEVPLQKSAGRVVAVQFDKSGVVLITDQNKQIKLDDVKSVFEGGGKT